MNKLNRRTFIKISALAGIGTLTGIGVANRDKIEAELFNHGMYRVSQSKAAIGTHVDITAFGESRMKLEDAVSDAFQEIQKYENLFTRYDHKSPVCELNEEGHLDHIDADLASLLDTCSVYHRDTNGAFDITVKPCIDLFKSCAENGRQPTDNEIASAVSRVGAEKLYLSGNKLYIPEGMGITLDGVAPGFIADRISELLVSRGITNYLINAGGEIRTSGHPMNGQNWRIAIQDPNHQNQYPGFIALNQGAVSTSGSYEIFYGSDRMFHHIVNARTGKSPNTSVSVTVTAPTATEADILSTALFVMSPQEALDYTSKHPSIACFIIDNEGNHIKSPNFKLA